MSNVSFEEDVTLHTFERSRPSSVSASFQPISAHSAGQVMTRYVRDRVEEAVIFLSFRAQKK